MKHSISYSSLPIATRFYKVCLSIWGFMLFAILPLVGQTPLEFNETQKLLALDGAAGDWYGWSVAIDGDIAVVGSPRDDDKTSASGGVYIYEHQIDGSWVEIAKLLASDGNDDELFGLSVDISGDKIIVGAYNLGNVNGNIGGAAYIFERQIDGSWIEVAMLTVPFLLFDDAFGNSVSISGNTAVVGAPGANGNSSAYVFERQLDGTWIEKAELIPSDRGRREFFGWSVAILDDEIVVGAYGDDNEQGSAFIFERQSNGSWVEKVKLSASDGVPGELFGRSVAITEDRIIVGADRDDDNGTWRGSAYIFERQPDSSWVEQSKLLASDSQGGSFFGQTVSISENVAIVGVAHDNENGSLSGSVYIYERQSNGDWEETQKLTASDGEFGDFFGYSVSISANKIIIGAPTDDDRGNGSGSAYIFEFEGDNNDDFIPNPEMGNMITRVWDDLNGNRLQDEGEPGIPGVIVRLYDKTRTIIIQEKITNSEGLVYFSDLELNKPYKLFFDRPNGYAYFSRNTNKNIPNVKDINSDYEHSWNAGFTHNIKFTQPGQIREDQDGGFWSPGFLSTFVWDDLDANGIQDAGEPGLEGIEVQLKDKKTGNILQTLSTDAIGKVRFEDVPANKPLKLFVGLLPGYRYAAQNRGDNDSLDSDVEPSYQAGHSHPFKATRGQQEYSIDAGLVSETNVNSLGPSLSQSELKMVYPNPVENILHIKSALGKVQLVQIYDFERGNLIRELSNTKEISVADLQSGRYILRIISRGNVETKMFIKK